MNAGAIDVDAIKARHPAFFVANWRGRGLAVAIIVAMAAIYVAAFAYFDVPWGRLIPGFRQLAWFVDEMIPPDPGGHFWTYLDALGETLAIALLGTLLGALLALPLGILAARNVVAAALLRLPIKRFFDAVRGVDTLIWALIWINVVGLGPFAGVLAIATSDFGALGKLFAEIIESADAKEQEGVRAAGGRRLAEVRFGMLPQVLPVIAGQVLYYIESNTRSAIAASESPAPRAGRRLQWSHPPPQPARARSSIPARSKRQWSGPPISRRNRETRPLSGSAIRSPRDSPC